MTTPHGKESQSLPRRLVQRLLAILEGPENDRAKGLQELREQFAEHQSEIDRCLRAAAGTVEFERLIADLTSVLASSLPTAADVPLPERIGPYQILDVLGEGGMGTVYLAERREPVRQRVAVKVIKGPTDTEECLARFATERQALALMSHPNVASVFDAGATEQGRPYCVMEYVPGVPLLTFCDEHRLDIDARLRLFVQICRGVHHVHQKGIIHRDLKPRNVLVRQVDDRPVAKVIDFGLAKAIGLPLTDDSLQTVAGQILGTLEYMSPEQADPPPAGVDSRADVYSLGVILFELLTGDLPIAVRGAGRELGLQELLRRITQDQPKKPSASTSDRTPLAHKRAAARAADTRSLRARLRGDLDRIVLKCLFKERELRYASAEALAADVERHLGHQPVEARPLSIAYRSRKTLARHRREVAAAAGALGLGAVLWWWLGGTPTLGVATIVPFVASDAGTFANATEVHPGETIGITVDLPAPRSLIAISLSGTHRGEPEYLNGLRPTLAVDAKERRVNERAVLDLAAGSHSVMLAVADSSVAGDGSTWFEGLWVFLVDRDEDWLVTWVDRLEKLSADQYSEGPGVPLDVARGELAAVLEDTRGRALDVLSKDQLRRLGEACEQGTLGLRGVWPLDDPRPHAIWLPVRQ